MQVSSKNEEFLNSKRKRLRNSLLRQVFFFIRALPIEIIGRQNLPSNMKNPETTGHDNVKIDSINQPSAMMVPPIF